MNEASSLQFSSLAEMGGGGDERELPGQSREDGPPDDTASARAALARPPARKISKGKLS